MHKKTITELLASFDEQSDKVKTCLTDLLDVVKDGRIPTPEAMSGLDNCVADLHTRYDAIYAVAKDAVSEEELPAHGVAATVIADALKNSRKKYLDEQLNRATAILRKFISIKSLIDGYAAALAPYQSAAASILDQMATDTIEELLPETEAPEIFLEAMQGENIHSPTGIDLMTRVQQRFPDMAITMGLLTKQYYFSADNDAPAEESQPIEAENVVEDTPAVIPDEAVDEEPKVTSVKVTALPITAEDASEEPPVEENTVSAVEEEDVLQLQKKEGGSNP